jgi:6-phospho-beta-glucosidase
MARSTAPTSSSSSFASGARPPACATRPFPPRYGAVGQETTGPGGLAKAIRTVPVILELAEVVDRRAAPNHWLVDFTNPVGIVTQALIDGGHRALGLCNVAIGMQRWLAGWLEVEPERVSLEHVGLNHLSWVRAVRVDGRDVLPDLLADDAERIAEHTGLPVDLVRSVGAIPSYYLRYYYLTDTVVREQLDGHTRARDVMDIERRLLEMYRDPMLTEKPALLGQRGGAYYSEAAVDLIASLHDGRGDIQVVDVRNDGALPDLAADAVVEIPSRIDRDGAHPLPLSPLAPAERALVQEVKAYERLAAEAARTGDRDVALRALRANPLARNVADPGRLLDELLADPAGVSAG